MHDDRKASVFLSDTFLKLPKAWHERIGDEAYKTYFKTLCAFLQSEYQQGQSIYPLQERIFNALQSLDYDDVRVVILGQDPYHGANQAIGLSFAVPNELQPKPPSLKNIFKELQRDLNIKLENPSSELSGWVRQGVLLLNSVLTVRAEQAFSHRGHGWEIFTTRIITELNARCKPLVFILWGAAAQKNKELIANPQHKIIESVHPSPLSASRGFLGSKPFSRCNHFLENMGYKPIDWANTN